MALDFFRIERGLELDDSVLYLQGIGAPGTTADTNAALVGSVYTNNVNGSIYTKITAGSGADKWQKLASEDYVNNAVGATVSWREPAVVRDNLAVSLPVGTATQPIVVDGVSITDGQRVLFSAIVGGDGKNVYMYDQATGTFIEDENNETNGDVVYIQSGTSAGAKYVYNGTDWVLSDQASLDELGFIRAFIGKDTAGNVTPLYSSTNFVSNATSLEAAIGDLDAALGANVSLGNFIDPNDTVNQNIQSLDTKLGASVSSGNFVLAGSTTHANIQALDTQVGAALLTGNFISAGDQLSVAITSLDNQFGPNVSNGNFVLSANKTNQNIQALDTALGAPVTNVGVILSTNSANANIQALGTELNEVSKLTTVTNVTSVQTIDTAIGAGSAKWLVRVELEADPSRVYATEIYALSNGTSVDFTRYGTLRIGTSIPGLAVTADFDAGNIRLRVAATGAVQVEARRVSVI